MEFLERTNKHKAAFAASLLLFLFAGARLVGYLLQDRSLPVYPTVPAAALKQPAADANDTLLARDFWKSGSRDFMNRYSETKTAATHEQPQAEQAAGMHNQKTNNDHHQIEAEELEQEAETQTAQAEEPPFELPYSFKAILRAGKTIAVLEDKVTGALTRCSVGDRLDGLTVVAIDLTSITLEDADGKPYCLRDAFGRKYGSPGTDERM